jgi:AcrR family transcriptional regulator
MPTARETLLDAAHRAVAARPWAQVRMVDVAVLAGVSRQTLYNEFGSKEGLGTALVDRLVVGFLDGAVRAAADAGRTTADPAACCAAAAAWMLRTARDEPIVHAALTGCWGPRMPLAAEQRAPLGGEGRVAGPGELAADLCEQIVTRLAAGSDAGSGAGSGAGVGETAEEGAPVSVSGGGETGLQADVRTPPGLSRACEAGLRIALSYVVAPSAAKEKARDEEVCLRTGEVVRALLAR